MARTASRGKRTSRGASPPADWDIPRIAYLYADPSAATLRVPEVTAYLRDELGISCDVREDFFSHHGGRDREALARGIAATRVRNIMRPFQPMEPVYGEVQFELRLLEEPAKRVPGILYDGYRYLALMRGLLPPEERTLRALHIAFEHRILGTFDEDGRYHARAVLCGCPSVVSTSGLVEAPAKPEAYYRVKAQLSAVLGSVPFEAAKEPFKGRFIDYDDPRLTEAAKGYALQCAMYHITKEPFCEDPECRLFDAHWQSELIKAQLESGRLCNRHRTIATAIRAPVRPRSWRNTSPAR